MSKVGMRKRGWCGEGVMRTKDREGENVKEEAV